MTGMNPMEGQMGQMSNMDDMLKRLAALLRDTAFARGSGQKGLGDALNQLFGGGAGGGVRGFGSGTGGGGGGGGGGGIGELPT